MLFCRLKTALIGHVQYHCLIFTTANTCTGHVQYHFLIFTIVNVDIVSSDLPLYEVHIPDDEVNYSLF